jgi:hypothetical protein
MEELDNVMHFIRRHTRNAITIDGLTSTEHPSTHYRQFEKRSSEPTADSVEEQCDDRGRYCPYVAGRVDDVFGSEYAAVKSASHDE